MDKCTHVAEMIVSMDGDSSFDDEELLRHLAECADCREDLEAVRAAARVAMSATFDWADDFEVEHPSDVDLAAFAAHGLAAPQASGRLLAHLSHCAHCRRVLLAVHALLDQHADLLAEAAAPTPSRAPGSFLDQVRLVLSTPERVGRVIGGFVAWIIEWAAFSLAIFVLIAAYVIEPSHDLDPDVLRFLGISPRDVVRLWSIAIGAACLGVLSRWLGAQLYHSAVEPD